ncbi:MAG: potassium transporter TrkG [Saprospiraceae bacterium]
MINDFLTFGDKNFRLFTNLIFYFALIIVLGQIFETGTEFIKISDFEMIYKPLNVIFAGMSVLMSIYLYLITTNWSLKVARLSFILVSGFYLIISLIWWFNLFYNEFDIGGFRLFLAVFISFLAISFKIANLGNYNIHPAVLFIVSFVFLILFGSICLMLPAATTKGITFIQALFTATSAVTVTGLAVLDTGKDFTFFGQVIILILIQLGGLGVLTVTNIFALIFKSSTSFRNRAMMSDLIKEMGSKNTFRSLFKVVSITLLVELAGAILIYFSISSDTVFNGKSFFFSVFHAVSAFCNAGFSTLSSSIYEESVKYNYFLQLIICWLIITGGIGYMVMINHYYIVRNSFMNVIFKIKSLGIERDYTPSRSTINSRMVVRTTLILLFSGTVLFMIGEFHGTLEEHSLFGKIVVSFFNSTTARTAGFNNVYMKDLGIPAVMLIMALMWIGASPASTGGGIKTTTFAVALLNLWNQIIGKEKLIIRNREIPSYTINQVNAVILLSIFAISTGTFVISFSHPDVLFKDVLFECISAYSTVGLSIGITPGLDNTSFIVLILLMFLGRVSFLTFLIGIYNTISKQKSGVDPYYPKENVFIN